MIAILRRAAAVLPPEAALKAEYERGKEDGRKSAEDAMKYERNRHGELEAKIAGFEKASGVRLDTWRPELEKIGDAVRMVLEGEHVGARDRLRQLHKNAVDIAADIENALNEEAKA